jgi:uncharacterized membrane protein
LETIHGYISSSMNRQRAAFVVLVVVCSLIVLMMWARRSRVPVAPVQGSEKLGLIAASISMRENAAETRTAET